MKRFICLLPLLGGCGLLDAATSDRPNSRQASALKDIFQSLGAFGKLANDPASATEGDLADIHATEPHKIVLDPDGTVAARTGATGGQRLDASCVTKQGNAATWDCPVTINGVACTAAGSGSVTGSAASGTSTLTCGATTVMVTATDVVFDEAAGTGSGTVTVRVGNPTLAGWATVRVNGLTFCTDESPPKPNGGSVVIDGEGPLDGSPFDPLTLKFSSSPICGTTLID